MPGSSEGAYVARALKHSPELRAQFADWEKEVHSITTHRRLPDPVVSFQIFLRSVETRVGPQLARISLRQSFPWPTKLSAGSDAAASRARAAQRKFEAGALLLAERVRGAYWDLWEVRRTRGVHLEHRELLRSLAESMLGKLAVGKSRLADQQQVALAAARLDDELAELDEREIAAQARLRAACGLDGETPTPTAEEMPEVTLPAESGEALLAAARSHPEVSAWEQLRAASEAKERELGAARYPTLSLGADWIIVGDARDPSMPDSGKDAVAVGAGLTLPLWQSYYGDAQRSARAEARAHAYRREAAEDEAGTRLQVALSWLRSEVRRVELHRTTLLPQAQAAYESVLGAYSVGEGTSVELLYAQQALLDLGVEYRIALARYARAWARIESIVGRPVRRGEKS